MTSRVKKVVQLQTLLIKTEGVINHLIEAPGVMVLLTKFDSKLLYYKVYHFL